MPWQDAQDRDDGVLRMGLMGRQGGARTIVLPPPRR
jgi:hypothetical protein